MDEIVRLTKDLIRFKSTYDNPEEINRCANFIEDYLKKHGIGYRRLNYENIPSVLVAPQGKSVPVILMSHIDVVEAPEELFEPYEKDGMLYGRGSLDDKYAVALSLVLLKENLHRLQKQGGGQNDLPFGILITGDEEVGGANGALKALTRVEADFCIALDGGGVETIIIKEKGIVHLKLISRGESAHAARPWLGTNSAFDVSRYVLGGIFALICLWLMWRAWTGALDVTQVVILPSYSVFYWYLVLPNQQFHAWYLLWPLSMAVLLVPSVAFARLVVFELTAWLSVPIYETLRVWWWDTLNPFVVHLVAVPFVFGLPFLLGRQLHDHFDQQVSEQEP